MPDILRSNPPILACSNLCKVVSTSAGDLTILDDVTFEVGAGQSLAVVGMSGSGKSTLLGLLAGLDEASSGSISLDGADLTALDEEQRAELRGAKVGFVFQSFQLLPGLTALENVMLPRELTGKAAPRATAESLLDRVGLGDRTHHYPRQLSGGEQQRVALARAFACEPKVLFADEPTGNLDTHTGAKVVELMFDLNRDAGTTLVLVTHDDVLAQRCTRRIELAGGRLVGPTEVG
ncbi:MAG: ABC transporter ATP-binding protein [Pseudomonadota bacterium]|nr:ABC transporter ATP-binding protein [Pseudomonadota bacterium]